MSVSIHAPAWGATAEGYVPYSKERFQSTLPHGERQPLSELRAGLPRFNPRSRMGSDLAFPVISLCIHSRFNPRSRMGSDTVTVLGQTIELGFNPRSRMGSDPLWY